MNKIIVVYMDNHNNCEVTTKSINFIAGLANSPCVPPPAEIASHYNKNGYCYVLVTRHGTPDFMGSNDVCTVWDSCDIFGYWKDMVKFINKNAVCRSKDSIYAVFLVRPDRWEYVEHGIPERLLNSI